MLGYTELSRSLCRTSQSLYPVNVHCDSSRKAYGMQCFPKLIDCRTLSTSRDRCSQEPTLRNIGLGRESDGEGGVKSKGWVWLWNVENEPPGFVGEDKKDSKASRLRFWGC